MTYYIVGLGNPGDEYKKTRHNVGRIILESFRKKNDFPSWEYNKKINALVSSGKIGKSGVELVLSEAFMNKTGASVKQFITSAKKAENLIVVHDEIDLPLGRMKIVFGRGSGGHRGVESIVRAIKTKNFSRVRIGISPMAPSGKLKKPKGEEKVVDFILGEFNAKEDVALKKATHQAVDALELFITDGRARAMNQFN